MHSVECDILVFLWGILTSDDDHEVECIPSVEKIINGDGSESFFLARNGHVANRSSTEVEVGEGTITESTSRTQVCDDHIGSSRLAEVGVVTLDLVTDSAA